MKELTEHCIPLHTNYSDAPLIRFIYNDNEYYALVDTGSEQTLIDRKFAEDNKLETIKEQDDTVTLHGLSGDSSSPYRHVSLDVDLGVRLPKNYSKFKLFGLLTDLRVIQTQFDKRTDEGIKVPVLLGSDLLSLMKAKIDFKDGWFKYNNDISSQ